MDVTVASVRSETVTRLRQVPQVGTLEPNTFPAGDRFSPQFDRDRGSDLRLALRTTVPMAVIPPTASVMAFRAMVAAADGTAVSPAGLALTGGTVAAVFTAIAVTGAIDGRSVGTTHGYGFGGGILAGASLGIVAGGLHGLKAGHADAVAIGAITGGMVGIGLGTFFDIAVDAALPQ